MTSLPNVPLSFTAALVGAAILVAVCAQAARPLLAALHRPRRRPSWGKLRTVIIAIAALLAPVFFLDMFMTVTHLLGPSFGRWAWTVPAATEGSFTVLYLLDLYLQQVRKPMGWLRWAPYPFAAASLFLNVYASWGNIPAMTGHAVVTIAFFLPLLAGEAAVRSLSVSDDEVKLAAETVDARRYALDFVRDQKGILWRLKVPSLLKRQIVRSRPPAAVIAAVTEGVRDGGAAKWESAVEKWVTDGLTRGVQMTVKVAAKTREIERQAQPSPQPSDDGQPVSQPPARKPVSQTARNRAKVTRLLTGKPELSLAEVAAKAGVSESTVTRIKREMPVPIRAAAK